MSKTDKDLPTWVKRRREGWIEHDHRDGVCIMQTDGEARPTCGFVADRRYDPRYSRVPRGWVRQVWHGPERARERDDLRDAVRRSNADLCGGADLENVLDDFDFPCPQARHSATYLWE